LIVTAGELLVTAPSLLLAVYCTLDELFAVPMPVSASRM
jgi:hypothetical protein